MLPQAACVFSAMSWTIASGVYKKASAETGVLPVNLLRCLVSMALGALALPFVGGLAPLRGVSGSALAYMGASGIMARLVGDTLFILSASTIGVSRAMPIAAIYPVWSVLLTALGGEKLDLVEGLCLLLTCAGVILVIRSGHAGKKGARLRDHPSFGGYLLAFATSGAWALGLVATKWGAADLNPILVNFVRMSAGALSLILVLAFRKGPKVAPLGWGRGSLVGASALESWLASVLWVYGLSNTTTAVGSCLSSLAPVFTVPWAIFYLREKVTASLVIGILMATSGVIGLVAR